MTHLNFIDLLLTFVGLTFSIIVVSIFYSVIRTTFFSGELFFPKKRMIAAIVLLIPFFFISNYLVKEVRKEVIENAFNISTMPHIVKIDDKPVVGRDDILEGLKEMQLPDRTKGYPIERKITIEGDSISINIRFSVRKCG